MGVSLTDYDAWIVFIYLLSSLDAMPTIGTIAECMEQFAPANLAEDWDNVGLLVGSPDWSASKVMTCLTVTPTTIKEAIDQKADLIVSHHPLPFHPLRKITQETTAGSMLLELIAAKIGVYSPHTAFDSAPAGINQYLAIGLGLQQIEAITPSPISADPEIGSGRIGATGEKICLAEIIEKLKEFLGVDHFQICGEDQMPITKVAIACGSGGSMLAYAIAKQCDCFITGETDLHTCLEAEARGVGLIMTGHFASERFALLMLAEYLSEHLSGIEVWASNTEKDPIRIA